MDDLDHFLARHIACFSIFVANKNEKNLDANEGVYLVE